MKLVLNFKVGDFATGEIAFFGKKGADLSDTVDKIKDSFSYREIASLGCLPKGYEISNVELRLIDGRKILKRKPIANIDEPEE